MLELVEDEVQAVRVVKLALEVDLRLGARLAGEVKPAWQEQTVGLVAGLKIPSQLKNNLLERTRFSSGNSSIADLLDEFAFIDGFGFDFDNEITDSTFLEDSSETALLQALNDEDSRIRSRAAEALGEIGTEAAIPALLQALHDHEENVRDNATHALEELSSELAIPGLLQALHHKDYDVRERAAYVLEQLGSKAAIPGLLQALHYKDHDVQWTAACVLGQLGSEAAIPALLEVLNDEDYQYSPYRWRRTACVLVKLGSEEAIPALLQVLHDVDEGDDDYWFREEAIRRLGKLGSEAAIPVLLKALHDTNLVAREIAASALGQLGTEAAIPGLLQALHDEEYVVRKCATFALTKIGNPQLLPTLCELLQKTGDSELLNTISAIQNRCKFYNYTLTQPLSPPVSRRSKRKNSSTKPKSISLMHILHLSDLHFGTLDNARDWHNQLAADLYNDLSISHIDALILSGDIANYSTQEEYKAAEQFLYNLCQDFPLKPEQIILVPGNHDLNWKLAKKAYKLIDRDDYDGELKDGEYIEESASVIRVRDQTEYKQRFAHFSSFYETIKQKPYPLDYDQQFTLDHLKEQNLLILGLNSAWQLDHHYKSRASINTNALSNALTQIRRNSDYKNSLKIAVWHHPLDSAYSDRITDQGFLEQLAVNGFRFFLHGHIHKAETSLFRYDMSTNGRKLDRICAGTFGAPVREWVPGYPLQYNLLKFEDNQLTVYTRRREELNGAWKPDARWLQGAGKTPLDYYAISLVVP